MKYVNSVGTLCVSSETDYKFVNFTSAVKAMNAVLMFYAYLGYSVHASIYEETKRVEVSVHFESFCAPVLPDDCFYSKRLITSQPYNGFNAQVGERVRVVTYNFVF